MSQVRPNPPSNRSWRDIPQPVAPRIRTLGREGRKRLALALGNIVGLVLVLGAAGWGFFEVKHLWETNPSRLTAPTKGEPIRSFVVRTDGVLDETWVRRTLDLPSDASLMAIDLVALKGRLEESGQVSKAVIERRFPDVLAITLQERAPVARVMARIGDSAPVSFMVARDGMVYSGAGYGAAMADTLPYIDGIRLVREGSGFARIPGMEAVADLLGTAQSSAPELYGTFKIVSLARFALDRTLMVRSTEVETIIFGASQDSFYRQIARLDYILSETRHQKAAAPLKSVNLALGEKQVPIAFDLAHEGRDHPSASALRSASSSGSSFFSTPSRNTSPSHRDF